MTTAIFVLGYVVAIAAILIAVSAVVVGAAAACQKVIHAHDLKIEDLTRRQIGGDLYQASWWFSEDGRTMRLVAAIAQDLVTNRNPYGNVSEIREQWRKDPESLHHGSGEK